MSGKLIDMTNYGMDLTDMDLGALRMARDMMLSLAGTGSTYRETRALEALEVAIKRLEGMEC